MRKIAIALSSFIILSLFSSPFIPYGKGQEKQSAEATYEKRMDLYKKTEAITNVPWYFLAAVDAYERGVRRTQKDRPTEEGVIGIYFSPQQWVGPLNPNMEDTDPLSISLFDGMGLDGNGDGIADRMNDEDVLYSIAQYLEKFGFKEEDFRIALWEYYQREQSVAIISGHAKVYKKFNRLDLSKHTFPMPLQYDYSYRDTWGDRRGWGGRRIHEGTDIFAGYHVPVLATAYGIVEIKGWNKYGGWRVGIRDTDNIYHYYAHLSGFEKGIEEGTIVAPGDVIGYVGSSGYGKPGTQGKFPPHLHYGMYRDTGYTEWSFDPYPALKSWERKAYQERRKKK
ncbi:M23 family metallopeptidase [Halalkalibacterium ligniniphilum]|uniref:M23 family metallopeptidase n=2 Tax=Halalkalibacterium ligniniphilum TaxID=1134413 RepID=UPI0003463B86|nr:M23 family metallopeptidase [Halalkalibacterium ligniniphilum]